MSDEVISAPDVLVDLHTGERVPLRSLYEDRPVALVFLRHLGCLFCREHVATLRELDAPIVFVAMASPDEARAFKEQMKSPQTFIADRAQALYGHFGMRRGKLSQMFNAKTFKRGMDAMRKGYGSSRPNADPMVLGGTVVLDREGNVTFLQRAQDAADNTTPEQVLEALRAAEVALR